VVLPGHPNQRYVVRENADGSLLLQPARVVTEPQQEYEGNPDLRGPAESRNGVADGAPRAPAPTRVRVEGDYSAGADSQLDALEAGPDVALYNAVLDACELIFRLPGQAQALSPPSPPRRASACGCRFRDSPATVFLSTDGPRIEAVFPHP